MLSSFWKGGAIIGPCALLLAGLAGAFGGWRFARKGRSRRAGITPHCPNCDYPLIGLGDAPTRCPECGVALTPQSVRLGDRSVRRSWVIGGVALALLGLAAASIALPRTVQRIRLTVENSIWYQLRQLNSDNPTIRENAMQRLSSRAATGMSPAQQAKWYDRLIYEVDHPRPDARGVTDSCPAWLSMDMALNDPWCPPALSGPWVSRVIRDVDSPNPKIAGWAAHHVLIWLSMDFRAPSLQKQAIEWGLKRQLQPAPFEGAGGMAYRAFRGLWQQEKLDAEQTDRFLRNDSRIALRVRPRIGRDDPLPFAIVGVGHSASPGEWKTKVAVAKAWTDGQSRSSPGDAVELPPDGVLHRIDPTLGSPGHHRMDAQVVVELSMSLPWPNCIYGRTERLSAEFDVVDPAPPIKLLTTPDVSKIIPCVSIRDLRFPTTRGGVLTGTAELNGPPVNVAFYVLARVGKTTYQLGDVAAAKGKRVIAPLMWVKWQEPLDAPIRFEFLANDASIRRSVDLDEGWTGKFDLPEGQISRVVDK